MLSYWFYPNPGSANYGSPKVLILFGVLGVFFLASFALAAWRNRHQNSVTRRLAKSWAAALRWFSIIGIVLIICRVEEIQFFAMRILWAVWGLSIIVFILLQAWFWKRMHYSIIPRSTTEDPREKYLPRKK